MTIEQLEELGYVVYVQHFRAPLGLWKTFPRWMSDVYLMKRHEIKAAKGQIDPRGGMTVVAIVDPTNTEFHARGEARCSPKDNFNRRRGREIALGRALKQAGTSMRP